MGHNRLMPCLPAPLRSSVQCVLLGLCLLALSSANAQVTTAPAALAGYDPATGDAWLDRHVRDINVYAARHPRAFVDEVSRYYATPRAYVEAMLQQPAWTPGDIFIACAVAQRLEQSCRTPVREWSGERTEGWAGVSGRLGLEPGSREHRLLRTDVEASYRRWARPLLRR